MAETVDECRTRAGASPQVRLLEEDGNTVTVHVLDPASEDARQVLSDASDAGRGVGRLGSCGDTALQIYLIVKRPLAGGVSQDEAPTPPEPVFSDTPPPANPTPTNPQVLDGSVDLTCRGTYTECYGRARGPLPGYSRTDSDGSRGIKRVPGPGRQPEGDAPGRTNLETAIGQCLHPHFPDYTTPGWDRFGSTAQQAGAPTPIQYAFPIVQIAARQALEAEKRRYGKLPYGDNSYAYLEGWLGRCLWDAGAIAKGEDPRAPYKRFLANQRLGDSELNERYYDWDVGFRSTWSPWHPAVIRNRQTPLQ